MHAYNCTKNNATDFSPYYLMPGWKPRLPVDLRFGLMSTKLVKRSHNKLIQWLSEHLKWCYKLADHNQQKESIDISVTMIGKLEGQSWNLGIFA